MVFADTSGFIGAYDRRDPWHARVARLWKEIAAGREGILTTDLVFAETVTYLRGRGGFVLARRVGEAILGSPAIEIVHVDGEAFRAAWREFLLNGAPKLSLCDAASFVVMRERGIRRALTVDDHFADAGFEALPGGRRR